MGTKGAKAGNIYSSLKSRGLVGTDGKDPMLNLGSAAKFNAGLKKASADGKLDDNPKFKAAVDNSSAAKYKKPSPAQKSCYKK